MDQENSSGAATLLLRVGKPEPRNHKRAEQRFHFRERFTIESIVDFRFATFHAVTAA